MRPLVSLGMDAEMGLQRKEFMGRHTDPDNDGVTDEVSVGDVSAMTLYVATFPRPVTQLELDAYIGGKYHLSQPERESIRRGAQRFGDVGRTGCHVPAMQLRNSVFSEPSLLPEHRFTALPIGDPVSVGLDSAHPL